jgi:hypothetical protein
MNQRGFYQGGQMSLWKDPQSVAKPILC